jgi:hypothetical protein
MPRMVFLSVRSVLTVLVSLAALASAALAQPALTVSPTSGPPTGKITVSGTGFGASDAGAIKGNR